MVTEGKKRHIKKRQARLVARQEPRAVVARHRALGLELEGDVRATRDALERKRFLIVCEGKNTEPQYFEKLAYAWRLRACVVSLGGAGAPEQLFSEALSTKEKSENENNCFDEVWAVFDKDEIDTKTILSVRRKAAESGIKVAFSNECFELWLLLHFQDDGWHTQRRDLPTALDAYLPGYSNSKSISSKHFALLRKVLPDAMRRAERLEKDKTLEDDLEACPYTNVHELVTCLACCNSLMPHIQKEIDAIFLGKK